MLGGYLRILLQLHHCLPRRQPELAWGLAAWPETLVPADGLVACAVPKAHLSATDHRVAVRLARAKAGGHPTRKNVQKEKRFGPPDRFLYEYLLG